MMIEVLQVTNSVVGESFLPNLPLPAKFFLRPIGEAALDVLHGSLQTLKRRQEQMNMVWHQDILVQQIRTPVIFQHLQEEVCPSLVTEKRFALRSLRSDEVCLPGLPYRLSAWDHRYSLSG